MSQRLRLASRSSALVLGLAATCLHGCAHPSRSASQLRVPEPWQEMADEDPALRACCPETAEWMEAVLAARCDQFAERGEPKPEGCR